MAAQSQKPVGLQTMVLLGCEAHGAAFDERPFLHAVRNSNIAVNSSKQCHVQNMI